LDPARAAADGFHQRGRYQLSEAAPERVGVDVPLDARELASLAHHAVADDAFAIADDARVTPEVEVKPLLLQIGLRERGVAVQQGLERNHELGHRRRVGGDRGCQSTIFQKESFRLVGVPSLAHGTPDRKRRSGCDGGARGELGG
jgi:hypothetical protein